MSIIFNRVAHSAGTCATEDIKIAPTLSLKYGVIVHEFPFEHMGLDLRQALLGSWIHGPVDQWPPLGTPGVYCFNLFIELLDFKNDF